jgi:hypothetical protein
VTSKGDVPSELQIIPNIGIGPLRFGMGPDEVRRRFPEEETYEEWMGGNLNDSLLYTGLILGFDAHDSHGPLVHSHFCEVSLNRREDATLWERGLFAWTKASIRDHLENNGIAYETDENGEIFVSSLSMSMSFDESELLEYIEMWSS